MSDNSGGKSLVQVVWLLVRWGIALLLLYLISRQFSLKDLADVVSSSQPKWLIVAFLAQLTSSAVAAMRWSLLMRKLDYANSLCYYLASYFKAVLFNQGLPTSIGGDTLRVIDLVRSGSKKRNAVAAVLADRMFGISGLLILALIANNALAHGFPDRFVLVVNLICSFALLAIPTAAIAGILPIIRTSSLQKVAFFEPLWIVSGYVRTTMLSIGSLSKQCLLALVTHSLTVVAFVAIGQALSVDLSWQTYLAFVPPLMLFALIPLSLAGWGVRETGAVTLLGLVGVAQVSSFAMSVSYGLVLMATAAPGLIIYLYGNSSAKRVA